MAGLATYWMLRYAVLYPEKVSRVHGRTWSTKPPKGGSILCSTMVLTNRTQQTRVSNLTKFLWGRHVQVLNMWEDKNVRRPFWGPINHQADLQTAKNPKIKNSRLQFDLWPLKIKRLGASKGKDEATKHTFCRSKGLITVSNASTGNV